MMHGATIPNSNINDGPEGLKKCGSLIQGGCVYSCNFNARTSIVSAAV